jgi:exosortase
LNRELYHSVRHELLNSETTKPHIQFAGLVALSLITGWRTIAAIFSLATTREEYTQILLVVPVVVAFFYLNRTRSNPVRDWRGGLFLLTALLLGSFAHWNPIGLMPDVQLSIAALALVIWWIGSFIFSFGPSAARLHTFPIAFQLWLVPWPQLIVDNVVGWLQHSSAFFAQIFFVMARIPASLDGLLLTIPGLALNIAPECSSIRSSLLLVFVTMILAQLFLKSPWRKFLLVAAALPLSAMKNGFRIFTLGFLTTKVDPSYISGNLHRNGGVVFLAIALAAIVALLLLLKDGGTGHALSKPTD